MPGRTELSLSGRLAALAVGIVFAVPTAFLLWFVVNLELAAFDQFLGSAWLWGTIGLSMLVSFFWPDFFARALGAVWDLMQRLARWFH